MNVGARLPGVFHTQFWVSAASRTGRVPHSTQACWCRALLPPRAQPIKRIWKGKLKK